MIEYEDAKRVMLGYLAELEAESRKTTELRKDLSKNARDVLRLGPPESDEITLALIEDATLTGDFGWVFFYQSTKWIETEDFRDMLVGHGPVIVSKSDGRLYETGSAHSVDFYIKNFRETGDPYGRNREG